jgi:hypothetical protein
MSSQINQKDATPTVHFFHMIKYLALTTPLVIVITTNQHSRMCR